MTTLIEIDSTPSTNTLMKERADTLPDGSVILARCQTAGRGQRGNSWEAEPGKNVTMSLLLRDIPVEARRQFAISEAVALAVADTAEALTAGHGGEVTVKWPNDIYVADRKIAGILIECALSGSVISHAIAGIGLNVDQTRFESDAPHPVSVAQITGSTGGHDLKAIAETIAHKVVDTLDASTFDAEALHARYLSRLWRRSGVHCWRVRATAHTIRASIVTVSPEGFLTLLPEGSDTPLPPFAFKEIEAISHTNYQKG